jgi:hypothetical protein
MVMPPEELTLAEVIASLTAKVGHLQCYANAAEIQSEAFSTKAVSFHARAGELDAIVQQLSQIGRAAEDSTTTGSTREVEQRPVDMTAAYGAVTMQITAPKASRCDRCGDRAVVSIVLADQNALCGVSLCSRHAREASLHIDHTTEADPEQGGSTARPWRDRTLSETEQIVLDARAVGASEIDAKWLAVHNAIMRDRTSKNPMWTVLYRGERIQVGVFRAEDQNPWWALFNDHQRVGKTAREAVEEVHAVTVLTSRA